MKTEVREAEHSDLWKSWSLFRKKMEPIRKWYKEEMDKKSMNSELLKGLQEMTAANQKGLQEMTEAIMSGNREADIQTDRQADRQTGRQTDKQTGRQTTQIYNRLY